MTVHVGSRVTVGSSKKVHIIRPGTIYSRPHYFTTYCGSYGNPDHGWMRPAIGEATCKTCVKRHGAS